MSEGRRYRSNSLRISAIGLKFGVVMHNNTKLIAKWLFSANFCAIYETFKFSLIGLDQAKGKMTHTRKCE